MDRLFAGGLPDLIERGVRCHALEMPRAVGARDLAILLSLRTYLRANGPFDVIHGHSSKAGAYARLGSWGLAGVRVYTPHAFVTVDPGLGWKSRFAYGNLERALSWLGHGIIAVSRDELKHAISLGLPRGKVRLVPNGADVPPGAPGLEARRRLNLPDTALIIGFVGRFVPQKDPLNLLRAFDGLAGRFPDIHLVMVGAGPLENSLRSEADTLGLSARVHWPGPEDGPAIMSAFDIFALPSLYEGMPYVLIEAMARGLPIVATSVGGTSTLLSPGDNGFIVPPGRPDLLCEAISALAADQELRERMGRESERRSTHFTVDVMIRRVLEFYSELLAPMEART